MLRFPAEAPDPSFAGRAVGDDGRPAAHAVAIAIERVFEGQQCLVRDRFDQASAKDRNGHTPNDDRGFGRDDGLTGVPWNREEMKERLAR